MHHVGERLHVTQGEVGLQRQRLAGGVAHDQMGFHFSHVAQHLQQTHAIDGPAGTRDANNQSFHIPVLLLS